MAMSNIIKTLQGLKDSLPNYIQHVRFPLYKDIEEDTTINFSFPLTVFIGGNGTRKSSVLKGIAGCPRGESPRKRWFSTNVDPIKEKKSGKKNSIVHGYDDGSGKIVECLKYRIAKRGRTQDYWEPSKPRKLYGLDPKKRYKPIDKNVVYLDFRSLLPAFDKSFYFTEHDDVQSYLRRKSSQLKRALDSKKIKKIGKNKKPQNEKPIEFNAQKLQHISKILGKQYVGGTYMFHRFFDGWAESVYLKTDHHEYSEAFAGSGESAIAVMVHKIEDAPDGSLILLDEPEVSLHPEAQKKLRRYLLEKIKTNHHQIIISSHSPFIAEDLPKEAIKVFRVSPSTGKTEIIEDIYPNEAFSVLGHTISEDDKNILYVEDKLAKELIEAVLNEMDETIRSTFIVKPLGNAEQIFKEIAHSSTSDSITNKYFVLDLDMQPKHEDEVDIGYDYNELNICLTGTIKNDLLDKNNLQEIIKTQSNGMSCNALGLSTPPDGITDEKCLNFLKAMEDKMFFLPADDPEDIIWDEGQAKLFLQAAGIEEAETEKIMKDIHNEENFKKKFDLLCEMVTEGEQNNETFSQIHKMFLKRFINQKPQAYEDITSMLTKIRNAGI